MKVKELVEKLKEMNQELDVYIPNEDVFCEYYIVHSVYEKELLVIDEDVNTVIIDYQ